MSINKFAIFFGGTNGLGLATAKYLHDQGYNLEIIGRDFSLAEKVFKHAKSDKVKMFRHDFLIDDIESLFGKLQKSPTAVFYTAGIGRIERFSATTSEYIENCYRLNVTTPTLLLNHYYSRLSSEEKFHFGWVTSISGHLSSPMLAIYAASKSAASRLIESINAEIDTTGSVNVVTDFCPGNFEGSSFFGKETNLESLETLAISFASETLRSQKKFIPKYDSIYRSTLSRYYENPEAFGFASYKYKVKKYDL